MKTTRVVVYLNESEDSFFGFKNEFGPPALRKAARFTLVDVDADLEKIWEQLNVDVPSADWALQYRVEGNRSLSIGDVVVLDTDEVTSAWTAATARWEGVAMTDVTDAIGRYDLADAGVMVGDTRIR